jgi:catechol 2,3-dioxygenase-like lactoylglutathione lyase family enzyme
VITGLNAVEVVTLFVEDLALARTFYRDVFGLESVYEDANSTVLRLDNLMINLLAARNAGTLVEPVAVGGSGSGPRLLFTIRVDDVDAVCAELARHGVKLLNGPIDRPWGRRTAAFADPAGHVWEVAQLLPEATA